MSLQIPDDDKATLRWIAALPESSVSTLIAALASAPPIPDADKIASRIAPEVSFWTEAETNDVVTLILTLYSVRSSRSSPLEEFLDDVCGTMRRDGVLRGDSCDELRERLKRLLSLSSIEMASKVGDLATEHANLYDSARIVTDIRPVFGALAVEGGIEGVVVVNVLKLKYFDKTGPKEIYIGLEEGDIDQLRETIDRAVEKAKAVRSMLVERKIVEFS